MTGNRQDELLAILNGWADSPQQLESRAKAAGMNPRCPCIVLTVAVTSIEQLACDTLAHEVWQALERASRSRGLTAFQIWSGSEVTVVLQGRSGRLPETAKQSIADAKRFLVTRASRIELTAGIGAQTRCLAELASSLRDARLALSLGKAMSGNGSTTAYDDIGATGVLFSLLDLGGGSERAQDFVHRCLDAIMSYEKKTHVPLLMTLRVLFDENGNVSSTARRLRLNRQSLLHRLARAQELSNLSLPSSLDRFALELAVRVHQTLEDTATPSAASKDGGESSRSEVRTGTGRRLSRAAV